jgi:hypothetical protein
MTWFAFQGLNNGQAVNLAGTQEKQAVAEGFHGYATQAQAQAAPNSVNLVTRVFADTWIADYSAAVKEQAAPGQKNANITNPATAVSAATTGIENSIPGVAQIGGLATSLGQTNTWLRVAKVVIGGALLMIGIAHMTGASNAVFTVARNVPVPV